MHSQFNSTQLSEEKTPQANVDYSYYTNRAIGTLPITLLQVSTANGEFSKPMDENFPSSPVHTSLYKSQTSLFPEVRLKI